MTRYQVWQRDEYGAGSILFTSDDLEEAIKRAKQEVTNANVNNALTADDREKNWEAYMVMIGSTKKKTKKYVYAGGNPRTKDNVYDVKKDGGVTMTTIQEVPSPIVRIYLGNISTSIKEEIDWYAKDARRRIIETVDHPDLEAKTHFFIQAIGETSG